MKTSITLLLSLAFACPVFAQPLVPVDSAYNSVIPPGTIKGVLLTGIRHQENTGNPTPVLVKLYGELSGPGKPNDKKLDSCMLVGESSYVLPKGTFNVRVTNLSCLDTSGGLFSSSVKGFLSASNGLIGLSNGNPEQNVLVVFTEPFLLHPYPEPTK